MSEISGSAPAPRKIDMLKGVLNAPSVQEQFKNALKDNSGSFVASVIDLYNGDPSLQECEPKQIVMEALKAAVLKLPINKALGFAYIVVYKNSVKDSTVPGGWKKVPTPTFIPGYKGYIQLAMRTGQYRTINADVVYEGEVRKLNKLSGEIQFDGEKTSDKIIGYFCYFELLNGFSKTLYMTVEEMAKYAKRYSKSIKKDTTVEQLIQLANPKSSQAGKVGWEGNFEDMALKTVIRRLLSKYGYLSVEMQSAISSDTEPEDDRDKLISQHANSTQMNVQDVQFEEVKTGSDKEPEPSPENSAEPSAEDSGDPY